MSAAVDFAPRNFGRHTLLDGMARPHHSHHDPYASGLGLYAQGQQAQQPPQNSQLPRLPPMSTMISAVTSNSSPTLSHGRGMPYGGGKATYYSDYATPSPVGPKSPQLPLLNSDSHPVSRRAVDIRPSPALSSTASDRSTDEIAQELRSRQTSGLYDHHGHSQVPRPYFHHQSPRLKGDTLKHENVFSQTTTRAYSATSYSPPQIRNGGSTGPQLPRSPPSTQPSASPKQESKSMSISNLLHTSSEPATPVSSPSAHVVSHQPVHRITHATTNTSTKTLTTFPIPNSEYRITVRQQPFAARSCGFGERDRRVIDPPPIVQLTIHDGSLSAEERARRLRHQFSVVHCSIWDDRGVRDMSSMPEDFRQQRRLMGTLVASPFVGADERGQEGCFFCFPDLSCRTPGVFRLKFALVVLDPARMCTGDRSAIVATAMSDPFQVYNAKDFPGMKASTALTKRLKEQGCLISIKKGNERREGGGSGGGAGGGEKGGGGSGLKGRGVAEEDEDDEERVGGGDGDEHGEESGDGEVGERARKRMKR